MKKRFPFRIVLLALLVGLGVVSANMAVNHAAGIGDYALEHPETKRGWLAAKIYQAAAGSHRRQLHRTLQDTESDVEKLKDETMANPSVLLNPEWIKRFSELKAAYGSQWLALDRFSEQMEAVDRKFDEE